MIPKDFEPGTRTICLSSTTFTAFVSGGATVVELEASVEVDSVSFKLCEGFIVVVGLNWWENIDLDFLLLTNDLKFGDFGGAG